MFLQESWDKLNIWKYKKEKRIIISDYKQIFFSYIFEKINKSRNEKPNDSKTWAGVEGQSKRSHRSGTLLANTLAPHKKGVVFWEVGLGQLIALLN